MSLQNALGNLALDTTLQTARDNVATAVARLEAIRDRLPAALNADGGLPVHVANLPATQPVSGTVAVSGTVPVSLATNTPDITDRSGRLLGHVTVDSAPSTAVTGPLTDTQLRATAVPVSASALPLPSGAAQEHSIAASPASVRLSDGSSYLGVTAGRLQISDGGVALSTSDSGLGTDGATPPAITGTGVRGWLRGIYEKVTGTLTVSGTVAVSSAPTTAVTGPLTDTQLRASAVPVSLASAPTTAITAAALPLPSGAATETTLGTVAKDATLTGGTQKAQVRGGAKGSTTAADVTSTAVDANTQGLDVSVKGTVPVSLGTNTPDVTDRAARELGRARLWDGTDEATVIPRGTTPSSSDKGLAVVSLITRLPTYQTVTAEITSGTAIATAQNLTLWHPSALAKDVFIVEIGVNLRVVQTAGTFGWELQYFTAENGTPGGAALTPQPFNLGDAASGLTVRTSPTGAVTTTGQTLQRATFPLPAAATPLVGPGSEAMILYRAQATEDAITLRSGSAEGLLIRQNIIATLTTAPIFNVYVRYVERA